MTESIDKRPNTPEYVEVTKTNVIDRGENIEFEFKFAGQISEQRMQELWSDSESTVHKTMLSKLQEKGWLSDDGKRELIPFSNAGKYSDDGKTWTFD